MCGFPQKQIMLSTFKYLQQLFMLSWDLQKERERQREREIVSSTAHSIGQFVWIPHSGSYLTQYDLTPSYTHLNKWANTKEWDTVRKEDKRFYPQCWICYSAVLSSISSPGFFSSSLTEWPFCRSNTDWNWFECIALVWTHCHLLDEWRMAEMLQMPAAFVNELFFCCFSGQWHCRKSRCVIRSFLPGHEPHWNITWTQ